jgi:Icc protein
VELADAGELPAPGRTGVVLAGDLWADPACVQRGGLGDVRTVWQAFASAFCWVVGVAGNHDDFGGAAELARLRTGRRVRLLDGDACEQSGLRIAGVSGIIGPPRRPWRRHTDEFQDAVLTALSSAPDVLVLHEGPDVPASPGLPERRGSAAVREAIEAHDGTPLVVCGHAWWPVPLGHVGRVPVLNVDGRVVVLHGAG